MLFLISSPTSLHPPLQTRTEIQAHNLIKPFIWPLERLFIIIQFFHGFCNFHFYSNLVCTWLQQSRHRLRRSKIIVDRGCGFRADRTWYQVLAAFSECEVTDVFKYKAQISLKNNVYLWLLSWLRTDLSTKYAHRPVTSCFTELCVRSRSIARCIVHAYYDAL